MFSLVTDSCFFTIFTVLSVDPPSTTTISSIRFIFDNDLIDSKMGSMVFSSFRQGNAMVAVRFFSFLIHISEGISVMKSFAQ